MRYGPAGEEKPHGTGDFTFDTRMIKLPHKIPRGVGKMSIVSRWVHMPPKIDALLVTIVLWRENPDNCGHLRNGLQILIDESVLN